MVSDTLEASESSFEVSKRIDMLNALTRYYDFIFTEGYMIYLLTPKSNSIKMQKEELQESEEGLSDDSEANVALLILTR